MTTSPDALAHVEGLAGLDAESRVLLARGARPVHLKSGQAAFAPGQPCAAYLIVTAGSVRVSINTEGGREMVLYRVGPNEACVLTTACLLGGHDYDASGTAESEIEALAVPKPLFDSLMARAPAFRAFVFGEFGGRFREVLMLVQAVAERHVDKRLARFLADRNAAGPIETTHQEIAAELGTAREVVSRLLKEFSARGLVHTERGRIVVTDRKGLEAVAAHQ